MTKQELFFYDNGAWSHDPKKETFEESHVRAAKRLAAAETWAKQAGFYCEWSEDEDECIGGDCEPCASDKHHPDCLVCILHDPHGNPVQSLGSICVPSRAYRRVVEAELALEAMPEEVGK